jgi:hypothetical protein
MPSMGIGVTRLHLTSYRVATFIATRPGLALGHLSPTLETLYGDRCSK